MMRKKLVRAVLIPIGIVFVPVFSIVLLMSPVELYKEFFRYVKSGEAFGPFDS